MCNSFHFFFLNRYLPQSGPTKLFWHLQLSSPRKELHLPPFLQGKDEQGCSSNWQKSPKNPVINNSRSLGDNFSLKVNFQLVFYRSLSIELSTDYSTENSTWRNPWIVVKINKFKQSLQNKFDKYQHFVNRLW